MTELNKVQRGQCIAYGVTQQAVLDVMDAKGVNFTHAIKIAKSVKNASEIKKRNDPPKRDHIVRGEAVIMQDNGGNWIHPCCKHVPGDGEMNLIRHAARTTRSRSVAERWARQVAGVIQ